MSYNFNSIVGKNEVNELREMIFRRAREKAREVESNEQTEIMDLARNSFVSEHNPFSQIVNETKQEIENTTVKTQAQEAVKSEEIPEGIGFPMRRSNEDMQKQTTVMNEQVVARTINNNMAEARAALSNKKSFMGALDFLNSQAAVSLMRTRADKFEIVV